jgi:hypothetical protein
MTLPRGRPLALIGLVTGLVLSVAYFVCQWLEPHGPGEFAYHPFTPVPLPYAPMRGFTYEQLWGHVRRVLLLGPGMALLVWGLAARVRLPAPRELRRPMLLAVGACLLLTALLMLGVLRGRALIDDELAYRQILTGGGPAADPRSPGRYPGADAPALSGAHALGLVPVPATELR